MESHYTNIHTQDRFELQDALGLGDVRVVKHKHVRKVAFVVVFGLCNNTVQCSTAHASRHVSV